MRSSHSSQTSLVPDSYTAIKQLTDWIFPAEPTLQPVEQEANAESSPPAKKARHKPETLGRGKSSYRPNDSFTALPSGDSSVDFICNHRAKIIMFGSEGSFAPQPFDDYDDEEDDSSKLFAHPFNLIGNLIDELADCDSVHPYDVNSSISSIRPQKERRKGARRSNSSQKLSVIDGRCEYMDIVGQTMSKLAKFPYPNDSADIQPGGQINFMEFKVMCLFLHSLASLSKSISSRKQIELSLEAIQAVVQSASKHPSYEAHLIGNSLLVRFISTTIFLIRQLLASLRVSDGNAIDTVFEIFEKFGFIDNETIISQASQFSEQIDCGGCFTTEILLYQNMVNAIFINDLCSLMSYSAALIMSDNEFDLKNLGTTAAYYCGNENLFKMKVVFDKGPSFRFETSKYEVICGMFQIFPIWNSSESSHQQSLEKATELADPF